MKKRIVSALLALFLVLTLLPMAASAADVVASGDYNAVTWSIDSDGTLTVSGSYGGDYYTK